MHRDVLLAALVSCVVSTAITLVSVGFSHGVAAQETRPDMITLRDQAGNVRATFGVADNGIVGLFLVDRSGSPRAGLALTEDGTPTFILNSTGVGPSAELRVTNDGTVMVFKDRRGLPTLQLQSKTFANGNYEHSITFDDPSIPDRRFPRVPPSERRGAYVGVTGSEGSVLLPEVTLSGGLFGAFSAPCRRLTFFTPGPDYQKEYSLC